MKHLSPDHLQQKRDLAHGLQVALQTLQDEIAAGNSLVEQIREAVEGATERVNVLIADVNALQEEIQLGQEEFSSEQPEGWHSEDAGVAYGEWMTKWEEPFQALEVVLPEIMDDPDYDLAELLADLPDQPEILGGVR